MTPAESELIEAALGMASAPNTGHFDGAAKQARLREATGKVCAERLGPLLPEIRQCIREQLSAQKRLRQFYELPGFGGDSGACATIWREVEMELGMRAAE